MKKYYELILGCTLLETTPKEVRDKLNGVVHFETDLILSGGRDPDFPAPAYRYFSHDPNGYWRIGVRGSSDRLDLIQEFLDLVLPYVKDGTGNLGVVAYLNESGKDFPIVYLKDGRVMTMGI